MFLERSALKYLKFEPGSQLFFKGLASILRLWLLENAASRRKRQIRGKARGKEGKRGGAGRKSKIPGKFLRKKEPGKV